MNIHQNLDTELLRFFDNRKKPLAVLSTTLLQPCLAACAKRTCKKDLSHTMAMNELAEMHHGNSEDMVAACIVM